MKLVEVRIHRADERRALDVLGSAVVQIDRDPPRAFLEDRVTKAPEIQLSIQGHSEERVTAVLSGALITVYASRTAEQPRSTDGGTLPVPRSPEARDAYLQGFRSGITMCAKWGEAVGETMATCAAAVTPVTLLEDEEPAA